MVLSSLVSTNILSCISIIIEEVKIAGKNKDKCSCCILYIVLQSASELVFILFTVNTYIIIKKMFLNMIIPTMQRIINHIKWEK